MKRGLFMADINYYSAVKKKLLKEKGPEIKALGYNLSCGLGKQGEHFSLEARLQPLPGSPDPIEDNLFTRIKGDLEKYLRDNNGAVLLNIKYLGIIRVQDKP